MAVSTQAGNSADLTAAAQIALEVEGFAYLPRALGGGYTFGGESMARTIEIDDAIWEQLCEQARQLGCDANALAQNLLADSLQQKHALTQQLSDERAASE
jgi:hypothetical protein